MHNGRGRGVHYEKNEAPDEIRLTCSQGNALVVSQASPLSSNDKEIATRGIGISSYAVFGVSCHLVICAHLSLLS